MLVADLAEGLPVLLVGDPAAVGRGDRLGDHGCDGVRPGGDDDILDRSGAEDVALGEGLLVGAAVAVDVGDMQRAGDEGLVGSSLGVAGGVDGERAGGLSVVGTNPGDDLELGAVATDVVILLGDLEGRFDGFGAAVDEDGLADRGGRELEELGGESDGGLGRVSEGVLVGETGHLLVGDVGEFGSTVADGVEPEAGHGVHVLAALVVMEEDAFAFVDDQQSIVGGEVGVGLGGDPEVLQRLLA